MLHVRPIPHGSELSHSLIITVSDTAKRSRRLCPQEGAECPLSVYCGLYIVRGLIVHCKALLEPLLLLRSGSRHEALIPHSSHDEETLVHAMMWRLLVSAFNDSDYHGNWGPGNQEGLLNQPVERPLICSLNKEVKLFVLRQ